MFKKLFTLIFLFFFVFASFLFLTSCDFPIQYGTTTTTIVSPPVIEEKFQLQLVSENGDVNIFDIEKNTNVIILEYLDAEKNEGIYKDEEYTIQAEDFVITKDVTLYLKSKENKVEPPTNDYSEEYKNFKRNFLSLTKDQKVYENENKVFEYSYRTNVAIFGTEFIKQYEGYKEVWNYYFASKEELIVCYSSETNADDLYNVSFKFLKKKMTEKLSSYFNEKVDETAKLHPELFIKTESGVSIEIDNILYDFIFKDNKYIIKENNEVVVEKRFETVTIARPENLDGELHDYPGQFLRKPIEMYFDGGTTSFEQRSIFDITDWKIKLIFNDNTTEEIDYTQCFFDSSNINTRIVGFYPIKVYYKQNNELFFDLDIEVYPPTVEEKVLHVEKIEMTDFYFKNGTVNNTTTSNITNNEGKLRHTIDSSLDLKAELNVSYRFTGRIDDNAFVLEFDIVFENIAGHGIYKYDNYEHFKYVDKLIFNDLYVDYIKESSQFEYTKTEGLTKNIKFYINKELIYSSDEQEGASIKASSETSKELYKNIDEKIDNPPVDKKQSSFGFTINSIISTEEFEFELEDVIYFTDYSNNNYIVEKTSGTALKAKIKTFKIVYDLEVVQDAVMNDISYYLEETTNSKNSYARFETFVMFKKD